jgi:hypothetical protein
MPFSWCEPRVSIVVEELYRMASKLSPAEAELVELRQAVLEDWILVTSRAGQTQRAMERTLSWRITRPLRLVRIFSAKAKEIGLPEASQLAAVTLARRLGLSK